MNREETRPVRPATSASGPVLRRTFLASLGAVLGPGRVWAQDVARQATVLLDGKEVWTVPFIDSANTA